MFAFFYCSLLHFSAVFLTYTPVRHERHITAESAAALDGGRRLINSHPIHFDGDSINYAFRIRVTSAPRSFKRMNKRETAEIVSNRQRGVVMRREKLRISWLLPSTSLRTHTHTHAYMAIPEDLGRNPMVRHGIGSRRECKTRPHSARHNGRQPYGCYTRRENIIETFLSRTRVVRLSKGRKEVDIR